MKIQKKTLLYIGISPDKKNKPQSRQHLKKRVTNHYKGNAEGSTLRRSLGILLTQESNYPLRRVGSGKRMTLTHNGEQWLDDWMDKNAFVFWVEHQSPWELEEELLNVKNEVGIEKFENGRFDLAKSIFEEITLSDNIEEFLTLRAYEEI